MHKRTALAPFGGATKPDRAPLRIAVAWVLLMLMAPAPTHPQPAAAVETEVEITIDNFTFTPAVITIEPGTIVKWLNRDDIPHTVVAKSLTFKSKALDTDDSFLHKFNGVGEVDYFCSLHPHMTGKVIVRTDKSQQPPARGLSARSQREC